MTKDVRCDRLLALLLAASLALRVALALQGGQYFIGDEPRYHRGVDLWLAAEQNRWHDAADILGQPEHAAFVWLGALLTPAQHLLARFTVHGNWSDPGNIYASASLAASLLSVFSVAIIWLVHRLARAAGADAEEACWAALLAAASNTLFYYSRHLLPYDAALAAWLAALGLTESGRPRDRLAGGVLAGLTYHLYNGYWFLVPLAGLWSLRREPVANGRRPLAPWLAGAVAGLGGPLLVGSVFGGAKYWSVMRAFSGTVNQGLFAEGWSLPWEYLAHSESWPGLAVLAMFAAAALRHRGRMPRRVSGVLLLAAGAWGLMALMSTGLERFVVYARTARPLVPLLCLAGGWAVRDLLASPRVRRIAMAAVVAAAGLQFAPHFTRVFPREAEARILTEVGNPKSGLSVDGCIFRPLYLPVTRPDLVLVNAQPLYPVRTYAGYPAGRVLWEAPNPLGYLPYQYEGHTPRERRLLREHDIAIKLIRPDHPESVPNYPDPARLFSDADRADGFDHGRR